MTKPWKRIGALCLAVILLLTSIPWAQAEEVYEIGRGNCGAQGNNVTWRLTSDGILTISGAGAMADYTNTSLPEYVDEYRKYIYDIKFEGPITHIGDYAFYSVFALNQTGTTELVIPDTVVTVGKFAFYDFGRCYNLILPDSITSIGEYAFSGVCGRTSANGAGISEEFYGGTLKLPAHLKEMGINAFENNHFTTAPELPATLESIPDYAFYQHTYRGTLTIPDTVKTIGASAFYGKYYWDSEDLRGNVTKLELPDHQIDIARGAFGNLEIESVEIPEGWVSTGGSFSWSKRLKTVKLPSTLLEIGEDAFNGCTALTSVELPEGLQRIGKYAFQGCTALTTIDLPDSIVQMDTMVFYKSGITTQPDWPTGLETVGAQIFLKCPALKGVGVLPAVADPGERIFMESGITTGVVPDGVTAVPPFSFSDCPNLTTLRVSDTVTSFENGATYKSTNLQTVYYEGSEAQWSQIEIGTNNLPLKNARIICLGTGTGSRPKVEPKNTVSRLFWIFDPDSTLPVNGFYVQVGNGDPVYTGADRHHITIEMDPKDPQPVTISKDGYHSYTIPADMVGNRSIVYLYKKEAVSAEPFVQSVLLDESAGTFVQYTNLLQEYEQIIRGSEDWKNRTIYVDINWNGHPEGSITLGQMERNRLTLQEGFNRGLDFSKNYVEQMPFILKAESTDGASCWADVRLAVQPEQQDVKIDMGSQSSSNNSIGGNSAKPVDVLEGQSISLDFTKIANGKIPLSVQYSPDGTIKGVIGLKYKSAAEGADQYGRIQEALWAFKSEDPEERAKGKRSISEIMEEAKEKGFAPKNPAVKIGIETNVQFLLIFEGVWGESGLTFKSIEGAIILTGSASYTQYWAPGAYLKGVFEAAVTAAVRYEQNLKGELEVPKSGFFISTKFSLTVAAGVGIEDAICAQVEGTGNLDIKVKFPYIAGAANSGSIMLNATASLVGTFGGFKPGYQIWASNDLVIFKDGVWAPEEEAAALNRSILASQHGSMTSGDTTWSQVSREYAGYESAFTMNDSGIMAFAVNDTGKVKDSLFKTNVFPNSSAQVAAYGDGRQVAVWVDDVSTREDPVNRLGLYYSCCIDGQWSTPQLVWDNDACDQSPKLEVIDDSVYLVWTKGREPVEADADMDTYAASLNIACARLTSDAATFTDQQFLTDAAGLDMSAAVSSVNGQPVAAWIHSDNGLFKGGQALCYWDGTVVKTLKEGLPSVEKVTVSTDGTVAYSAYDGQQGTIYTVLPDGTAGTSYIGTKPTYVGSVLWYYHDGMVCSTAGDRVPAVEGSDWFVPVSGSGMTALVFHDRDEAGNTVVKASYRQEDGWTPLVTLIQANGVLRGLAAEMLPDGKLAVMGCLPYDSNGVEMADMMYYSVSCGTDLVVTNAEYDFDTLVPGGLLEAKVRVENHGVDTVDAIQVAFLNENSEILEISLVEGLALKPGDSISLDAEYSIPETCPQSLYVGVYPLYTADVAEADNVADLKLCFNDVAVEEMISEVVDDNGTVETIVRVVNRGEEPLSDIPVHLTAESAYEKTSKALASQTIETLAPGAVATLHFTTADGIDAGQLVYATAVPGQLPERRMSNNINFTVAQGLATKSVGFEVRATAQRQARRILVDLSLHNGTEEEKSARYIAAVYADGQMKAVGTWTAEVASGAQVTNTLTLSDPGGAVTVKLFTLDANSVPLEGPRVWELSE